MIQFFTGEAHGFIFGVFCKKLKNPGFLIIIHPLQGGFIFDQNGGNFTIIHHFLLFDEYNIPILNSGPYHAITFCP